MMEDAIVTDRPDIPLIDKIMAGGMAETLHKHYPNHLWAVNVNSKGGIATVYNMMLSGQMGYILPLDVAWSATEWEKMVMRAGGEILERYRQQRAKANLEELVNVPSDAAGRGIYLK